MEDFLAWLGNRELLGSTDEQACVRIMDGCLSRLMAEGQTELAAALLSGDETTFKLFRTEAPELVHLPDATYDWYSKYYLDGYYPIRFILRQNGGPSRPRSKEASMEPIYVTGHRNPDTDSIVPPWPMRRCKTPLAKRDYVPRTPRPHFDETQLVLDRFGFEPPLRIQTMRTQVRDLDYDTPPALGCAVTMGRAWDAPAIRPFHPRHSGRPRRRNALRHDLPGGDRGL